MVITLKETWEEKMEKINRYWEKFASKFLLILILMALGFGLAWEYQIKPLKAEVNKQKLQIEQLTTINQKIDQLLK